MDNRKNALRIMFFVAVGFSFFMIMQTLFNLLGSFLFTAPRVELSSGESALIASFMRWTSFVMAFFLIAAIGGGVLMFFSPNKKVHIAALAATGSFIFICLLFIAISAIFIYQDGTVSGYALTVISYQSGIFTTFAYFAAPVALQILYFINVMKSNKNSNVPSAKGNDTNSAGERTETGENE